MVLVLASFAAGAAAGYAFRGKVRGGLSSADKMVDVGQAKAEQALRHAEQEVHDFKL